MNTNKLLNISSLYKIFDNKIRTFTTYTKAVVRTGFCSTLTMRPPRAANFRGCQTFSDKTVE